MRPGDIVLSVPGASTSAEDTFVDVANIGTNAVNIQSFAFTVPLARTTLSRLGTLFGYNRVVNVPLNMELRINALVNELVNKDFKKLFYRELNVLKKDIIDGTDLDSFLIRRFDPNPNYITLDTDLSTYQGGSGFIFPQYTTNTLQANFDQITKNLKEKGSMKLVNV